jgi:uncharacterized protein (DUF927 family)
MDLLVDAQRLIDFGDNRTGIFVRAKFPNGKWDTADIIILTKESLIEWLESRGEKNEWAESCVGLLLGYGPLFSA